MERLAPDDGGGDGNDGGVRRVPERGTLGLPDSAWAEAQRRAAVIAPLVALDAVPAARARAAGQALRLSERTIYALLRRWRQSGGLVATLAPRPSPGGRGTGRLPAATEQLMVEAIRDAYLTRQKRRAEAVWCASAAARPGSGRPRPIRSAPGSVALARRWWCAPGREAPAPPRGGWRRRSGRRPRPSGPWRCCRSTTRRWTWCSS